MLPICQNIKSLYVSSLWAIKRSENAYMGTIKGSLSDRQVFLSQLWRD